MNENVTNKDEVNPPTTKPINWILIISIIVIVIIIIVLIWALSKKYNRSASEFYNA